MKKIFLLIGQISYLLLLPFLKLKFKSRQTTRLIIKSANKTVLVQNYLSDGSFGLPGGGIKNHEEPIEALTREVKEEINLDIENFSIQYLGFFVASNRLVKFNYHLWLLENDLIPLDQLKTNRPLEIAQIIILPINQLHNLKLSNEVKTALNLITQQLKV